MKFRVELDIEGDLRSYMDEYGVDAAGALGLVMFDLRHHDTWRESVERNGLLTLRGVKAEVVVFPKVVDVP